MDFEWDQQKARNNEKKHGVSFREATTIFGGPLGLAISDPDHSSGEYRFLSIGWSSEGNLLVVSYTERHQNKIRIISTRSPRSKSRNIMSKITKDDEMRPEYDFSEGVRGKHYDSYQKGTNIILLEPDIAEVFKDSESVNHALRMLLRLAGDEVKRNLTRGSSGGS